MCSSRRLAIAMALSGFEDEFFENRRIRENYLNEGEEDVADEFIYPHQNRRRLMYFGDGVCDSGIRRGRWIRERENHFEDLDDRDFFMRYRLTKPSVAYVLQQIEDQLEFPSHKNNCISPMNQLLCALRFYATSCFQLTAGDLCGFSTTTAHRIVHRVSLAIAKLLPRHVSFPETPDQVRCTHLGFYRKARFPRFLGAIDCTHVKLLKSPGGMNAEIFRNRKGYFSLNVQSICNANMEFMDFVARWPGSTHDSHIFSNCYRRSLFEQGKYDDSVLVGDSGYARNSYMMTPLDNCTTAAEQLYNESQIRTRNVIERTFVLWKRRFPAMGLGLRVNLSTCFPIIVATTVLHNIARRANEELPPDDRELVLPAPWDVILADGNLPNEATIVPSTSTRRARRENPYHRHRRILIDTHFKRLASRRL